MGSDWLNVQIISMFHLTFLAYSSTPYVGEKIWAAIFHVHQFTDTVSFPFFFSCALFLILEVLLPNSALGGLYNHSHKKKIYLLWFRTYSYWLVLMTYFLHRLLMFLKISWKSRKKLQPNFLVKIKVGGVEMLLWDPLLDGVRKCFPLCMCGVCMCVPHKFCLVFSQSSGFFNFLFWVVIPVVSESKFHHLFYFFLKFLIIQTSYF